MATGGVLALAGLAVGFAVLALRRSRQRDRSPEGDAASEARPSVTATAATCAVGFGAIWLTATVLDGIAYGWDWLGAGGGVVIAVVTTFLATASWTWLMRRFLGRALISGFALVLGVVVFLASFTAPTDNDMTLATIIGFAAMVGGVAGLLGPGRRESATESRALLP